MDISSWFFLLLAPETWGKFGATPGGLIGAILGVTVGVSLTAYFGARGKNLATKHDLRELQAQLSENIKITKSIEAGISREESLKSAELAFRQKQLSDLYGPLYSYLKSQKDILPLWRAKKMQDKNFEVKLMFAGQNKIMRELIFNNAHLIYGEKMPDCFVGFFTNTIIWDMYAAASPEGEVPKDLESDERTSYSYEFDEHVASVTEKLKKRIELLHNRYNFEGV